MNWKIYLIIIPQGRVGFLATRFVGYNHLVSNEREWNQETLLDRADFALQEQTEDNLMVAISRAWYNVSYTMAAKPIKSLEWQMIHNCDTYSSQ